MSQAPDMKEDNLIDPTRVYCTNALVKKVGGAVAVSLEDATLPGVKKNKHMTILYRRGQRWTEKDIELFSKATDSWIKAKYGNNKAPVTFTISNWGKRSVAINGDLSELCLHLRSTFAHMSTVEQRIPHCELFKHRGRHNNGGAKDKSCHICGESGHYRRNCPQKHGRKDHSHAHKGNSKNCQAQKHGKHGKNGKEKVKERLQRMISKTDALKQHKQTEIANLDEQSVKLQNLLDNADVLDAKTLRTEIKNIAREFKQKRKAHKCQMKGDKHRGKSDKFQRKSAKFQRKSEKFQRKLAKRAAKEEKKALREQRKKVKKEKREKLLLAQLPCLPSKSEINNANVLHIYVDGYNIIGCDSVCRKSMRGRGKGMRASRARLVTLLQQFVSDCRSGVYALEYAPVIHLYFDGNGKDECIGDVRVTFSTKKQIVDDRLVEMFGVNDKETNANILVVTSDRELTLRLDSIGVKIMKSSVFYKTFLKAEMNNKAEIAEEKEMECAVPGITDENNDSEEFEIISMKVNATQFEDEETDSTDYDQIEGNAITDEVMDTEFTEIFGEDMVMDSD